MSWSPSPDPVLGDRATTDAIETLILPRAVDLGEMTVRRALPSTKRQMVGPFIFFDQMGPAEFLTDQGIDVRPHPHINLATLTYLFEGEILHRDSLGTEQAIQPGAVNWMRAGRGIVHSERTAEERKRNGQRLFGIQTWMALPVDREEDDPAFLHHGAASLPTLEADGARARLIAGRAFGLASPLVTASETLLRRRAACGRRATADRPGLRGARTLHNLWDHRGVRGQLRARPAAGAPAGRRASGHGFDRSSIHGLRRRADGGTAVHLVELRVLPTRADRRCQGGMGAGPLRHRSRRRVRVHPAARPPRCPAAGDRRGLLSLKALALTPT